MTAKKAILVRTYSRKDCFGNYQDVTYTIRAGAKGRGQILKRVDAWHNPRSEEEADGMIGRWIENNPKYKIVSCEDRYSLF